VMGTARVMAEDIQGTVDPAAQTQPLLQRNTIQVFNPATGRYEEREMQSAPIYPAPAPVQAPQLVRKVEQSPPPVLVYNPRTGQYEPQHQMPAVQEPAREVKAPRPAKTTKTEKSLAQKMLDNFTRSTASGAGYTMGRTISRGILGIFGVK